MSNGTLFHTTALFKSASIRDFQFSTDKVPHTYYIDRNFFSAQIAASLCPFRYSATVAIIRFVAYCLIYLQKFELEVVE